jgi:glycerol uptake facilitator-like aquaporin
MDRELLRRTSAEFVGTALLAAIVVGSGIFAQRLSPDDVGLQLLEKYIVVQVAGACFGTIVANLMFELPAVTLSTHVRSSGGLWLGEFVATFGLLLVILGVVRSGRSSVAAYAVGGYIAAAYWFTSSTSFANPAIAIGRSLTNTFAGIAPSSVPMFVVFELIGGMTAVALALFWRPDLPAADLIVPHEASEPT